MDMILFTGQSNMQGQTDTLPYPNEPVENAAEYRFLTDRLVPLCHPTGEDIAADGGAGKADLSSVFLAAWHGHGSMLPYVCNSYCRTSGHRAVAVQCAKGSTTIGYWQRGGDAYALFLKKFRAAENAVKAAGETVGRRLAFFLQGESDACAGCTEEEYAALLTDFITALKQDIALDAFFVVRVGRFTEDGRDFPIIRAQEKVCADGKAVMATRVTGRLLQDKAYVASARAHLNNAAFEVIGREAGKNAALYFDGRPFDPGEEPYPELR